MRTRAGPTRAGICGGGDGQQQRCCRRWGCGEGLASSAARRRLLLRLLLRQRRESAWLLLLLLLLLLRVCPWNKGKKREGRRREKKREGKEEARLVVKEGEGEEKKITLLRGKRAKKGVASGRKGGIFPRHGACSRALSPSAPGGSEVLGSSRGGGGLLRIVSGVDCSTSVDVDLDLDLFFLLFPPPPLVRFPSFPALRRGRRPTNARDAPRGKKR